MASSYDKDFPPLESSSNPERNLFSRPFIQSTEVLHDGSLKQPFQAEQVLNWHTRNATVQNRVFHSIDQKIDKVSHHVSQHDNQLQHLDSTLRNMYTDLQSRVSRLDGDLHQYISQGYFGPEFDSKEKEIRFLKDQLDQIKRDHFTSTPYLPRPHPYSPSLIFPTQSPPPPSRPPDHSQFFKSTGDLFRKYPILPTEQPSTSTSDNPTETEPIESSSVSSWETYHTNETPTSDSPNYSDPDALPDLSQIYLATRPDPQPSAQTVDTSESSVETFDEPPPMVDEPPDQRNRAHTHAPPPKPTNGPWFNFDDVAPRQWRKRMSEMSAWLELQIAKGGDNTESILREFVSRLTGSLRDWYQALGEYRQLQLVRCGSVSIATGIVFREFLGDASQFYKQTRQEFFEMTVCSLNKEDIDYHYRRMSFRYHALGGINDETLRQALQEGIQSPKIKRHVTDEIPSDADIESYFSEQEDVNQLTSSMILDSEDHDSSSSEHSSYPDPGSPSEAYQATNNEISGPQIKIQIQATKYSKPIPVIAYFDTGAHSSMMNPSVLPTEAWKEEKNQFLAADGQLFNTYLVSKNKIGLQFFPSFTLWTHVIGTPLPRQGYPHWMGYLQPVQIHQNFTSGNSIQKRIQTLY
ncbi:hypothetical protein Ddye_010044 [Dipteronia dyeriana]|uniref:Uncharacterized protein n=1 Tax=Dipteronia dyeriana TaxID=168575 RepID=A0AAD9XCW3_9ROSI|nr:hypothetical protein Ddye_010044 [Dipteronia dyeriana]